MTAKFEDQEEAVGIRSKSIGRYAPVSAQLRLRRLLRRCKNVVGLEPGLLPVLLRLTPLGLSRQITEQTDLVVEGFPRSGNTFVVFALGDASQHSLVVSSHVHHPAQVMFATAQGVPTVLLVREPVATLSSYMIFGQDDRPRSVIREYISYHRHLIPYADQLLVCDFNEVTTDLSGLITRINRRFNMTVPPFDQSAQNVERVFEEISRQHRLIHRKREPSAVAPRPSVDRKPASDHMRSALTEPRHRRLLGEATDLYEYFSQKAAEQTRLEENEASASVTRMASPARGETAQANAIASLKSARQGGREGA